ncbi:MAG: phosphate signaling complex protein PhoU [Desulfamplus sp.]|nr:phosphate signaling complex protein PhoU [Desulfamplus sp.]
MSYLLKKELDKMKNNLLSLGAMIEERLQMMSNSIEYMDTQMAKRIIAGDYEIDEAEVAIEEECLKMLALYQPVAIDLRFLVAVIKINNDMERIADLAVNVAHRVIVASKEKEQIFTFDYMEMARRVKQMLKQSLDAFVNMDLDLAKTINGMDDAVDRIKNQAYDATKDILRNYPEKAGYIINMFLISRHLERIADLATNIAEEIIYIIEGEIVRHC